MWRERYRGLLLLIMGLLLGSTFAMASVKLPSLISNNMVLQEGAKDRIWGTADPSEHVTVTIAGKEASTAADAQGKWAVEIGPLKAGGPFEMTIQGSNAIVIHNVMVGEVWVCSGQSNMTFPVAPSRRGFGGTLHYKRVVATAHYPLIRMFTVKQTVAGKPQTDVGGRWEITSPLTVGHFSAVGYFFGLDMFKALHVPIGLIHSSWGGTPAEAWTSLPTLKSDPMFRPYLEDYQAEIHQFVLGLGNFPSKFESWRKQAAGDNAQGNPVPPPPGIGRDPRRGSHRPASLFNAMVMPLVPYRIKGVVWYQGEANSWGRGSQYYKIFPDLIRDWRRVWNEGNFPFIFVQLANFQILSNTRSFPLVREGQLKTLSLPKTGMAVTIDIGSATTIHPRNKQEVGRRLSLAARAIAYGQHIIYSGPIYKSMAIAGGKIRLHFTHLGGGLVSSNKYTLMGFEIAGADHHFATATAKIEGDTVVVWNHSIAHPVAVRYGWANNPTCDLYNQAGLPASPFRTDDWPEAGE